MVWWFLANIILTIHILLFVGIVVGLFLASVSILKRYKKISLAFWIITIITLGSQLIPGCQLTTVETWMRHQVDPTWERENSIAKTLSSELGIELPERFFTGLGIILGVVASMIFIRNYGKRLKL